MFFKCSCFSRKYCCNKQKPYTEVLSLSLGQIHKDRQGIEKYMPSARESYHDSVLSCCSINRNHKERTKKGFIPLFIEYYVKYIVSTLPHSCVHSQVLPPACLLLECQLTLKLRSTRRQQYRSTP